MSSSMNLKASCSGVGKRAPRPASTVALHASNVSHANPMLPKTAMRMPGLTVHVSRDSKEMTPRRPLEIQSGRWPGAQVAVQPIRCETGVGKSSAEPARATSASGANCKSLWGDNSSDSPDVTVRSPAATSSSGVLSAASPDSHGSTRDSRVASIPQSLPGDVRQLGFRFGRAIWRELLIAHEFTRSNRSVTVVPVTILAAVAASRQGFDAMALCHVALATVWGLFYIYTFDLSNQLVGVEEDRLNKPSRPLVTGLVSPRGARARSLVANLLWLCLSWPLGVAHFALWWQALIFGYHYLGGHKDPLGKAVWLPPGIYPMLGGPWQLVTGSPPAGAIWTWFGQLVFMGGLMMMQSDLRDMEGDAKIGRRTLPMVLGEGKFRMLSAAVYVVAPFFYQATMLPGDLGATSVALAAPLFAGLWYMAYRTTMLRSREADRLTYRLFCYWFCYMMVLPLFMRPNGF